MRTLFVLAPLALLAGVTGAQQKKTEPPAQEKASPEQQKLDELVDRMKKKQAEVMAAYKAAKTDEERDKIRKDMPGEDFVPEFRALAEGAKGKDAGARAWMWVLQLDEDQSEKPGEIVETMLSDHMESEVLADLAGYLQYGRESIGDEPTMNALHAMVDGSPHKSVRASALYTMGSILLESKSDAKRAEGRKYLERVVAEFPGIDSGRGTYAERAAAQLFELDHLQIGKSAPDFDAVDENGVKWKLSDYRGKVVVVDFWGFW